MSNWPIVEEGFLLFHPYLFLVVIVLSRKIFFMHIYGLIESTTLTSSAALTTASTGPLPFVEHAETPSVVRYLGKPTDTTCEQERSIDQPTKCVKKLYMPFSVIN